MSKEALTRSYIGAVVLGAAALGATATLIWPMDFGTTAMWLYPVLAILVALAARFPVELSRQAQASLFTVPIFTAVLVGHPIGAIAVAAGGTLVAEVLREAPVKAIAFNTGVAGLAAAGGGMVFFALGPDGMGITLSATSVLAAVAAGATVHATNVLAVSAMVTIRKGHVFWKIWGRPYAIEALQEGAMLALGLLAAVLIAQAWWGLLLIGIPTALAYLTLKHGMREVRIKGELAEELAERILELNGVHSQVLKLEHLKRERDLKEAKEEERRRLAEGLHDQTLMELTGLAIEVGFMERDTGVMESQKTQLRELRSKIHGAETGLRDILRGLYPDVLTNLGLLAALRSFLEGMVAVQFELDGPVELRLQARGFGNTRPPELVELTAYRVVQQTLFNAVRHGQPTSAEVTLDWSDGGLVVTVVDDGLGFVPLEADRLRASGHYGIASLYDRVEAVGGSLEIDRSLGNGTIVRVYSPFNEGEPDRGRVHAASYRIEATPSPITDPARIS